MVKPKKTLRNIEQPYYSYWQAFYLSFFNRRLYIDVGKRWKGLGLLYFLLISCLVSLPFSLRVINDYRHFFNEVLIQPLEQLPPIIIQNGNVSFDKPMPYSIKNKLGQVVAMVDTTGMVNSIDGAYPNLSILITKNKLFYNFPTPAFFFTSNQTKQIQSTTLVYPFSPNSNAVFVGKDWVKLSGINHLKYFFGALIYPTIALLFFGIFFSLFLVFALLGQFVAIYLIKYPISFVQSCRLLFVSATPFMVLLWLGLTLNWLFKGFGILLTAVLCFYFCYAILSVKSEGTKLVVS